MRLLNRVPPAKRRMVRSMQKVRDSELVQEVRLRARPTGTVPL
jgi:hypothetical protein